MFGLLLKDIKVTATLYTQNECFMRTHEKCDTFEAWMFIASWKCFTVLVHLSFPLTDKNEMISGKKFKIGNSYKLFNKNTSHDRSITIFQLSLGNLQT